MASSSWNGRKKEQRLMPMGNPADYPIGSPESRAAARAMLEAMKPPPLTPEEEDWLIIASHSVWLTSTTRAGLSTPEWDAAIQRAHSLMDQYRDEEPDKELISYVESLSRLDSMKEFGAAWLRRMPGRVFPFRILPDGRILERVDYNKWCADRWLQDDQDSRFMWCPWWGNKAAKEQ